MTQILELMQSGADVTLSVKREDLMEFGRQLIATATAETKARIKANEEDCLLSIPEVMNRLQIKDRTSLWRWAKRGYLEPVRVGKKCLYRVSDIDALIEKKGGAK